MADAAAAQDPRRTPCQASAHRTPVRGRVRRRVRRRVPRRAGHRPGRRGREPKAPTPPDPPATPVIRAVFMPRESLRPELPAQSSRRPVDHGSNRPGVVERQISRRRQITRRIGTAPDGGHRGPSTLQTPGGGVGAPAHSTPRGNVPNQMMSLLGGRLQTACRRRRWRRTQEDGTPRTGCHLTARLASYQA